ncbi:MAG TPA: hypothetical protein DCL21_02545, partial [Alphaproteobacteria bacterium]|nr:hypothetical protein [Alphaproteobacteria bacterium]
YQITKLLKNINKDNIQTIENLTVRTKSGHKHVLCKLVKIDSLVKIHHKLLVFQDRTHIVDTIKKVEKSERQLKEYANLLQSSFDDSFIPSLIITSEGSITNYNKSFHALVKKTTKKINKDSIFDILSLDSADFESNLINSRCFETSTTINNLKKDFVFNLHKIKSSKDKEFILCQIQDITKQKQAEAVRRKLEEQIRQTKKVEYMGEIAGMISHEFNNALMPIISFSSAVEKSLPENMTEEKDKLQKVVKASRQAKEMIHQIMQIKHIDFQKIEPIDLNELIQRNKPQFNLPNNIKLIVNNKSVEPKTMANYEVIGQAMRNAVSNAIQAIGDKPDGEIAFNIKDVFFTENTPKSVNKNSIELNKKYITFEIKDNGCGIDEKDIKNIFNPFFTTKHFNKQTGTGLTYIYSCMEKFKIPLVLKTKPNEGVSFTAFFSKI